MADEPKIDFGRNPFDFTKKETYAVLRLVGNMDQELAKEFEKRIRPQFDGFSSDLVIDLTECGDIHPVWSRPLMQIVTPLKTATKRVRVVSTHEKHRAYFQAQGVASSFPIVATSDLAVAELTAKKSTKLDVKFINPFLEGAIEVLKIQTQTQAKAGNPVAREPKSAFAGDISGVIGIVSESFTGSVVISFPEATFLKIMSRMLGEELQELKPELHDGAAELTNIIFGHAKKVLNGQGHGLKMATPSVITGKDQAVQTGTTGPRLAIPFESDAGAFAIEICVGE
jgi:chemotaxis protein CheX